MNNDLYITSPLDQQLPIEVNLDEVDQIINRSVETKNPELVFYYCSVHLRELKRRGLALSKALWLLQKNWDAYELGDEFLDTTSSYTGLHRHTIERYCRIWEMFSIAPQDVVPELQQHSLTALFPIANTVSQGYELDQDTWKELAEAPDYNSVSRILKEKTGKEGRSNSMLLSIDRQGSLWATTVNDKIFIGSLEISDDRDTVQKAIRRIIERSGIIQG